MFFSENRVNKGYFPYELEPKCGMIHNDHLGTPQKLTDASGTVVWAADYKPFGEATVTISTITNDLRFPGQYFDAETGLHQNWRRDYNAVIGRYPAADPLNLGTMHILFPSQSVSLESLYELAPDSQNAYAYVSSKPTGWIDPWGLAGVGVILPGGSIEGGAVAVGAGATGSAGGGVFWGGPQGANVGGFATFGAFAGGPGYGPGYPSGNSGNVAGGAYAGIGSGGFITNASCAGQLKGPFNTYSLNLGVGPKLSFQFGISGGTWIFSATYGWGIGVSGSSYQTNTWATK